VSSLLVILLVIAAGAALIAQLVWWLSGRPEPGRAPPPLVVPIHPGYARTPRVSVRVPAADAAPVAVPVAAQTADAVSPEVATDAAPAETIQFLRPTDDALQLLPARL
jgi:hypothetical protein